MSRHLPPTTSGAISTVAAETAAATTLAATSGTTARGTSATTPATIPTTISTMTLATTLRTPTATAARRLKPRPAATRLPEIRKRWEAEGERGNLSLFVAVIAAALLAVIGLTYDGASKVQALQRADLAAGEAARAAGQALAQGPVLDDGTRSGDVDAAAAAAAAQRYLAAVGVEGSAVAAGPTVTVTTRVQWQPVMLSMFGVSGSVLEGRAVARAAAGVDEEIR